MRNYLAIILTIISFSSYSQVNFFQTGARWGYSSVEHPDTPFDPYRTWLEQLDITGDTTINGLVYKKLHRHIKESDYPGSPPGTPSVIYYDYTTEYLRFDSTSNRVFYITDSNLSPQLIYDFNLVVGDTIPNIGLNILIVDSIEQVSFFGIPSKKFYYVSDPAGPIFPEQYIIEGMGGSNGLTYVQPHDVLVVSAHTVTDLICFQLLNDVYPTGSACDVFASVDENEKKNSGISVFPNPSSNTFRLKITPGGTKFMFKIFDPVGREVYSRYVDGTTEIADFSNPGFYHWKLFQEQKTIGSGKLIRLKN